MSQSKSFRVALLGAGIFAKESHLPAILDVPSLTLAAIYSRSYTSASTLASHHIDVYSDDSNPSSKGSLDDLLSRSDIDLVAWKAGKGVISENPVASTVEEARGLIEEYEKEYKPNGVGWIVAEQFPFEASFARARELIGEGEIGQIKAFKLDFFNFVEEDSKYNKTEWRRKPEYQGGYLQDGGVHFLAGMRTVLSAQKIDITSISAVASSIQPHLPPFDIVTGSTAVFIGETGTIIVDFGVRPNLVKVYRSAKQVGGEGTEHVEKHESAGVKQEFKAFAEAFSKGIDSEEWAVVEKKSGPRATLRDLALIEAGLKSQGSKIDLKSWEARESGRCRRSSLSESN
ncbi:BQ2448_5987 [Microbotryum intermedium]|uniref:BQ2448_5987 protein n=1 Tax=Microbotryum intermedium TaxID=269621 RepID=A0A238F5U4_9BASI|nr:BQ2448_5987 [Microbotryum intermedium]